MSQIKVTTGDLENQAKSLSNVAVFISGISSRNNNAINKMEDACSSVRVGGVYTYATSLIQKFTTLLNALNRGSSRLLDCVYSYQEANDNLIKEFNDWFDSVEIGKAGNEVLTVKTGYEPIELDDYFKRVTDAEYAKICGMWSGAALADDPKQEFLKKLKELPEGDPLRELTVDQIDYLKSGTGFAAVTITDKNGNALVIFAGTNGDVGDFITDGELTFMIESDQERQAWELVDNLRKTHSNIVVTGHSLGGYLATSACLQYSEVSRCIAFDPPGRGDDLWHMITNREQWDKIMTYEANGSMVSSVGHAMGDSRTVDVVENGSFITHNHDIDAISDSLGGMDRIRLSWGADTGHGGW